MMSGRQWLLVFCALLGAAGGALAEEPAREDKARLVAEAEFHDHLYERAEADFTQYIKDFANSPHVPGALLLKGQAQFEQGKFQAALDTLSAGRANAGKLADEYAYWIGQAQFGLGDDAGAASTFTNLLASFPNSTRRLDAVVNAAAAWQRAGDWPQIIALLGDPSGIFAKAAESDTGSDLVLRGRLLLAEAHLKQGNVAAAQAALALLASQTLPPELDWQRNRLLCQAKLAANDLANAPATASNLVQIARLQNNPVRLADSYALLGEILSRQGRWPEAASVWMQNFTNTAPPARQEEAVLNLAIAVRTQTNATDAIAALAGLLAQTTNAAVASLTQLKLGELQLRGYLQSGQANPGLLAQARTNFDNLLSGQTTNSLIRGRALLNRGWCGWLAADWTNSLADFRAAAEALPPSPEQTVALFKVGDVLYRLNDFVLARDSYQAVLDQLGKKPDLATALGDRALYQILQANLKLTNAAGAEAAMNQMLKDFPASELRGDSLLLLAESYTDRGRTANAAQMFANFSQLFPHSPLRSQVDMAQARLLEREAKWPEAIAAYEQWLANFPDSDLRPQVEYALGLANAQTGRETNALNLFTAFVARYPTNELAPRAQWWVADYYFGLGGTNFLDAEKNYELIFQTPEWHSSPLFYQAQLMAGLAAEGRQGFQEAASYLSRLLADTNFLAATNLAASLRPEVMLAYGNVLMRMDTNQLANFESVTNIFARIWQENPTNALGALALNELGDSYIQLDAFDAATNAYTQVIRLALPHSSLWARAQVGLGLALEKKAGQATGDLSDALLKAALDSYSKVIYTQNDAVDPFWFKKAALQALPLMDRLQVGDTSQFIASLERWLPQLKDQLEAKKAALKP